MIYDVSPDIVSELNREELVAVARKALPYEYKGDNVWTAFTELDYIAVRCEQGRITVLSHEER